MVAKTVTAMLFLALNFYAYNFMGREITIPDRASFDMYPDQIGPWQCRERGDIGAFQRDIDVGFDHAR